MSDEQTDVLVTLQSSPPIANSEPHNESRPTSPLGLIAPKPSVPINIKPFSQFSSSSDSNHNAYPPATSITNGDSASPDMYRPTSRGTPIPSSPESLLPHPSRPPSAAGLLDRVTFKSPPAFKTGSSLIPTASSSSSKSSGESVFSMPTSQIFRIPSEETRVLAQAQQATASRSSRNSRHVPARLPVILYRLDDQPQPRDLEALVPPNVPFGSKRSRTTTVDSMKSRTSVMSGSSRLPLLRQGSSDLLIGERGGFGSGMQIVAYAYQPDALLDGEDDGEDDDWLHDPRVSFYASPGEGKNPPTSGYVEDALSMRGLVNYTMIWLLLGALVALFIFYPVLTEVRGENTDELIANSPNINSTGQATAR